MDLLYIVDLYIFMRSNFLSLFYFIELNLNRSVPVVFVIYSKQKLCFPSIQAAEGQAEENGLQISSAFSLNSDTPSGRPTASFNPGRGSGPVGQLAQNGDTGTHNRTGKDFIMSSSQQTSRHFHSEYAPAQH